ncbi:hypothetical protein [Inquilinus limosus]|uniref:Uncharacterized protein n=1 Tax=Inquilinus limosus MP06 TaxID=1398085 RepID=A0A0A0D3S3_9PROT|nr:hypothetical protein [Inquilinus limosus]KGM32749.1 hypothetical protein P409_19630 [Inquilinus limosus MP06]
MAPSDRDELAALRKEWVESGRSVLQDDAGGGDQSVLHHWVVRLIDGDIVDDDRDGILSLVYHSLNFDIPFAATRGVREELRHVIRMKIKDPAWRRFPEEPSKG